MSHPVSQYSVQQVQEAHQELSRVSTLLDSGDTDGAIDACTKLIEAYPDYARAHVMAGSIFMRHGNFAAALPNFVRALLINPNDGELLYNLGWVYLELGAMGNASEALERCVSLMPESPVPRYLLGEVAVSQGQFDRAVELLEEAVRLDPANAGPAIRLAYCLLKTGRHEDAVKRLQQVWARSPSHDEQALIFQILGEFPSLEDELGVLEQTRGHVETSSPTGGPAFVADIPLHEIARDFAVGIDLARKQKYRDAWDTLTSVNKRIADATQEQRDIYFRQQEELLGKAEDWTPRPRALPDGASTGPVPLFVLGPSRSGKSTLEELVARLGGTHAGLENSLVTDIAQHISTRNGFLTEALLVNTPSELDDKISALFHERLSEMSNGAELVTITHPGAISDVGRLSDLFGNAKFVFLKRNHDDAAFRIFSYLYQENTNQFAYDIKDIYRYLELHDRMADVWTEKIADRALVVSYEDMVSDPHATLNRVADLCGMKPPAKLDVEISRDVECAAPYLDWLRDARDGTS